MTRRTLGVLAASTILVSQPALSQDQDELSLGTLILSGGLTPVESSVYGRSSTVLTEEDIEDRGEALYAADLIRSLPGVSVSRTGGFGGLTQIRLRGNEGNHTLVLIDGVEVADPSQGEYDFSGLLAADIARIEILRGPQSSIYGSNAIGGVISITTKRATEPGITGEVGVEVGSDGTTEGRMAVRLKTPRGNLSFSAARRDTGGFDISDTPGGEDDGDLNRTYNLVGSYDVTDTFTVGGTLRHVDRISDTDGFFFGALTRPGLVFDDASNATVQETFGSVFAALDTLGGRLTHRLDVSYSDINRQGDNSFALPSFDNTGTRTKVGYRGSYALDGGAVETANHILTFAAQYEYETFVNNNPALVFAPTALIKQTREQTGLVFEYQGKFENGFAVQGSVRHDFNDRFDDETTFAVGASYMFPSQLTRVHASYGTGVQNPTLFEQFGFSNNFIPNPNLEPEQSEGWDIGIEQQFLGGRGIIDVTYFNQVVTDEITAIFDPITFIGTPINQAGESDRQGIEVSTRIDVTDRLDVGLYHTWLDAENPNGSIEVRRPENETLLQMGYTLPNEKTRFNAEVQHVAGLFDTDFTAASFGANQIKLSDYTLVNLGMTHQVTQNIRIYANIRNVFDEDYEELDGYATEGRTIFFGVVAALN
ncbi:MAG: TonB-dependent receptor [Pseudomonadota bacterium]